MRLRLLRPAAQPRHLDDLRQILLSAPDFDVETSSLTLPGPSWSSAIPGPALHVSMSKLALRSHRVSGGPSEAESFAGLRPYCRRTLPLKAPARACPPSAESALATQEWLRACAATLRRQGIAALGRALSAWNSRSRRVRLVRRDSPHLPRLAFRRRKA